MVEIAFPTKVATEAFMRRGEGDAFVNVCSATIALAGGSENMPRRWAMYTCVRHAKVARAASTPRLDTLWHTTLRGKDTGRSTSSQDLFSQAHLLTPASSSRGQLKQHGPGRKRHL